MDSSGYVSQQSSVGYSLKNVRAGRGLRQAQLYCFIFFCVHSYHVKTVIICCSLIIWKHSLFDPEIKVIVDILGQGNGAMTPGFVFYLCLRYVACVTL